MDSGRFSKGGMGSDMCEMGTMPSGVDWREPLEPKCEAEGLLRAERISIAEVILENEGLGERRRGMRALGVSPLGSRPACSEAVDEKKVLMVEEQKGQGAQCMLIRHDFWWKVQARAARELADGESAPGGRDIAEAQQAAGEERLSSASSAASWSAGLL